MVKKLFVKGNIVNVSNRVIENNIYNTCQKKIYVTSESIEVKGMIDSVLDPSVISYITSIISAVLIIWDKYERLRDKKVWNNDRFEKVIKEKMTTLGVLEYSITAIDGFQNLLDRNNKPCLVKIKASSGTNYTFTLSCDGQVIILLIK
jgi:hypothetical protein